MTVGSRVNPNFPVPGVDQSSRGFRDNFSIIKKEIENLQSKHIQIVGGLISDPIEIGNGESDVVIPVSVNLTNIQAAGSNCSVQYNLNNQITGSEIYYKDGLVGINTSLPLQALDIVGNIRVISMMPVTTLQVGILHANVAQSSTSFSINDTNLMIVDNNTLNVGIGTYPTSRLDLISPDTEVASFRATKNNSDNTIRFTTNQVNATMGLVLEQRSANKVGGLRIDQNGNVSIHVNESMDANLSDASRVINILTNNNVGIGSMAPRGQLDVQGDAFVSGTLNTSAVSSTVINVTATSVDCSTSNWFTKTISAPIALSFDNVPGQAFSFVLQVTDAGLNITWPGNVRWAGGIPPVLTVSGIDILRFMTLDGGSIWHGQLLIQNSL
jgi:hypothetical protein